MAPDRSCGKGIADGGHAGAGALADAELLALILRTGLAGQGVLQLAQSLLDRFGGLSGLLHAQADDMKKVKGLGPAKRAEITAVLEIARRVLAQQLAERQSFEQPQAVKDYLLLEIGVLEHEATVDDLEELRVDG